MGVTQAVDRPTRPVARARKSKHFNSVCVTVKSSDTVQSMKFIGDQTMDDTAKALAASDLAHEKTVLYMLSKSPRIPVVIGHDAQEHKLFTEHHPSVPFRSVLDRYQSIHAEPAWSCLTKDTASVIYIIIVMCDLLEALEACHASHITHTLVSESSYLYSSKGGVLSDFHAAHIEGLRSEDTRRRLQYTQIMNRPPEFFDEHEPTPTSAWDIWCVGLLMYTLYVGQHPFINEQRVPCSDMTRFSYSRALAAADLPDTPFSQFIMLLLTIDKAGRPTASEVLREFKTCIHDVLSEFVDTCMAPPELNRVLNQFKPSIDVLPVAPVRDRTVRSQSRVADDHRTIHRRAMSSSSLAKLQSLQKLRDRRAVVFSVQDQACVVCSGPLNPMARGLACNRQSPADSSSGDTPLRTSCARLLSIGLQRASTTLYISDWMVAWLETYCPDEC